MIKCCEKCRTWYRTLCLTCIHTERASLLELAGERRSGLVSSLKQYNGTGDLVRVLRASP